MIQSEITRVIENTKEKVWEIITNNKDYRWRTDLSKIEIIDENNFIEYTKKGFPTNFKITKKEPYERYEFDLKNENLTGHFIATIREIEKDKVEIKMIEDIEVKSFIMRLLAKSYLKKQQQTYMRDLQEKLKEM